MSNGQGILLPRFVPVDCMGARGLHCTAPLPRGGGEVHEL